MATTYYLAGALLNHVLRGTGTASVGPAYARPSQCYVALFTAAPGLNYPTTPGTEVSGGSYARMALDFNAPVNNVVGNALEITFPTATGSWGTVTHFCIFDASSGGNLLHFNTLAASREVLTGDIVKFPAGQLTVTVT